MADTITVGRIRIDRIDFAASDMNVDLGDLRPLARSIDRYGVLEPIDVEIHGNRFKVRFGRHRVAAARMTGKATIPAVIHTEQADRQELLEQRVQENLMRLVMGEEEKARIIKELRGLKCTDEGIARTFGASVAQIKKWAKGVSGSTPAQDPADDAQAEPRQPRRPSPRARATRRLIEARQGEFDRYLAEEKADDEAEKTGAPALRLVS